MLNSHTSLLIITTFWKHEQSSSFLKPQFDKLIPKLKQLTIVNESNNLQHKMIKWKKYMHFVHDTLITCYYKISICNHPFNPCVKRLNLNKIISVVSTICQVTSF